MQAGLNFIVDIIAGFVFVNTGFDVVTNLLADGVLRTILLEVGVDLCRFSGILSCGSVLEPDSHY